MKKGRIIFRGHFTCIGLLIPLISTLFIGCGASIRVPVIRPAEINLKSYDTIALGEIKAQGDIKAQEDIPDIKLGPLSINISKKEDKKDFYFTIDTSP